ncbi:glycoside hydrolase family 2 TIM barrel-domain containing protein [Neolewinella aurantiaca]|nr:glycoside hydrolase family 2 TIM barrel-domain containing protein [Neolewinella aurantiaca]
MRLDKILLVLGLFLVGYTISATVSIIPQNGTGAEMRTLKNINKGWKYFGNNTRLPDSSAFRGGGETVDLPHTWNQWDAVDNLPGYRRDASWYQKSLFIPSMKDRRILLYFEGANTKADVYCNGKRVGGHVGGYLGFEVDLTEAARPGEFNDIAVRVDNGYDPNLIPSQKSDFFIYGGLTRDVWLKTVPVSHIERVAVSTPKVTDEEAETNAVVHISTGLQSGDFRLEGTLIDPSTGEKVGYERVKLANGQQEIKLNFPSLRNPKLWSPDQPDRYQLRLTLIRNGEPTDEVTETFGYRYYHFEKNGPFYLNGKRLLLRGTHRHEEHAGFGAALNNTLHLRDVAQMKDMGVNFLRLGHYPQDPEVYRACDSLGIIVWDELPWCRGGLGGPEWQANTERLLVEQIEQNFNHPSIFFWSLGNEIYWLPDFPGGDDPEKMNAFLTQLNDRAHALDPGRLTAIRKYYDGADLVDVFSPSIWSGWYAGVYKNYLPTLEKQRSLYPAFLHMEYGGSSHVGRHTETPITGDGVVDADEWAESINQLDVKNIAQQGDWTENYIVDLFDWHLSVSESTDWFAGNAQWAFKDFGTPLRPENPIPYLNQKGLVDRAGKPKDAYYVFKSYWSDDPFTYIESHTWTERSGPEGRAREISVYSNCTDVELIHNGMSLGTRKRKVGELPAAGLHWPVLFAPGTNELIALGYEEDEVIARDTLKINYRYEKGGTAKEIVLSHRALANGNELIQATMVDENGLRVLDYEGRVYFSHDGAGELLVDYGTPTRSRVVEMANGQAAIEWQPAEGYAVFEARNQDFKGSYLTINRGAE